MNAPLVYVVILTWNGKHDLEICLPSVFSTAYPRFAVLVVDNGSDDSTDGWVQATFPQVELLQNGANIGFAAGNNAGISYALVQGAAYIALLNNDIRVDPDWLSTLVSIMEADPTVAIAGSRILSWDGCSVQHTGRSFIRAYCAAMPAPPSAPVHTDESTYPAYWACGAAMLLRAATLRELGLFDPAYFIYGEDVDLSLRAWVHGYRVVCVPASVVYHRGSGSALDSDFRRYLSFRNTILNIIKYYEATTLAKYALLMADLFVWRGRRLLPRVLWRDWRLLLQALRVRHSMQIQRRRQMADVFALIEPDIPQPGLLR